MGADCYFVQYKFIIPDDMKHSAYTYQKLFRAIYGYTQTVTKSNGKSYSYHRKGILSHVPYIKQGKNCVVIPQDSFSELKNFFQTGQNPTHKWQSKGDWKAVYYLNEKNVEDHHAVKAVENMLDRTFIMNNNQPMKLEDELQNATTLIKKNEKIDPGYKDHLLSQSNHITGHQWFRQHYNKSARLINFNKNMLELKNNP